MSVWAGLEVDGLRHSADGGCTWQRAAAAIPNSDVHNVLVAGDSPKTVFTVVNNDVWTSVDNGDSWRPVGARDAFPWSYPRGIAARPDDPNVVFVTIGDATPGRIGTVMRTSDAGNTWESLPLPHQPNSAMWTVSVSPPRRTSSSPPAATATSTAAMTAATLDQAVARVRRGLVAAVAPKRRLIAYPQAQTANASRSRVATPSLAPSPHRDKLNTTLNLRRRLP